MNILDDYLLGAGYDKNILTKNRGGCIKWDRLLGVGFMKGGFGKKHHKSPSEDCVI